MYIRNPHSSDKTALLLRVTKNLLMMTDKKVDYEVNPPTSIC